LSARLSRWIMSISNHVENNPEKMPDVLSFFRGVEKYYNPTERLAIRRMIAAAFRITQNKGN